MIWNRSSNANINWKENDWPSEKKFKCPLKCLFWLWGEKNETDINTGRNDWNFNCKKLNRQKKISWMTEWLCMCWIDFCLDVTKMGHTHLFNNFTFDDIFLHWNSILKMNQGWCLFVFWMGKKIQEKKLTQYWPVPLIYQYYPVVMHLHNFQSW